MTLPTVKVILRIFILGIVAWVVVITLAKLVWDVSLWLLA